MAKRPSIPSWDELNRGLGSSKVWENTFLPPRPSTPEEWRDTMMAEVSPVEDDQFETMDQGGASMSVTSSSNPSRPRTLQAGYDYSSGTLTVIFRDGTWWEYKDVPESLWQGFNSAESKGKFMRSSGLDTWGDMGPADVTNMPRHRRAQMNDVQKFADYMYSNNNPNQ
ncbi:KTSC domain containing protein [uncultured Caudovirales phage]|uniref:KTSC domain containing protein n=1 Tax=uncultured Caudovirales phage TaxID=2100421 RepID=A0A6J7WVJ3_9CAUD|nr:KTSC domain containing protein [uncultured Caudovirales phage]CAB5219233.1 KTSC domain containing protein [uncultured Caudovirales phage]